MRSRLTNWKITNGSWWINFYEIYTFQHFFKSVTIIHVLFWIRSRAVHYSKLSVPLQAQMISYWLLYFVFWKIESRNELVKTDNILRYYHRKYDARYKAYKRSLKDLWSEKLWSVPFQLKNNQLNPYCQQLGSPCEYLFSIVIWW